MIEYIIINIKLAPANRLSRALLRAAESKKTKLTPRALTINHAIRYSLNRKIPNI